MQSNPLPEQDASLSSETVVTATSNAATSRRAWMRRGAIAVSPVVVSLVSAPVQAAGVCVLPSGYISATTFASRHPGAVVCVTSGPNFWQANFATAGAWPAGTTTAKFKDAFSVSPGVESGITGGTTLKEVLDGSFSLLAKYTIAAYLNALKGTPGFPAAITAAAAVSIYKSDHGGPFSTLLVTGWTEAQTVAWLQVLMT